MKILSGGRTNRIALGISALLVMLLCAGQSSAFMIQETTTGATDGFPVSDLYKVTITGNEGSDGGANSFTITWVVPEGTERDGNTVPFDLVVTAEFTIVSLSANTLVLDIKVDNTDILGKIDTYNAANDPDIVLGGGLNSVSSLGFNITPDVTGVSVSDAGGLGWEASLNSSFPEFNTVDICTYPNNSCSGGSATEGVIAGEMDMFTLTLSSATGAFGDDEANEYSLMLLDFPLKMQGIWGSFEVAGSCCDTPPTGGEIPEPATVALILLGLTGVGARHRRRQAMK